MRRLLLLAAAPVLAVGAVGPVLDRLARRLMQALGEAAHEAGLATALDPAGRRGRAHPVAGRPPAGGAVAAGGPARWSGIHEPPVAEAPTEDISGRWVPDPREAILLLHGYNGSVAPDLVEVGPFLRRTAGVLGLDFRGHGASDERAADDVRAAGGGGRRRRAGVPRRARRAAGGAGRLVHGRDHRDRGRGRPGGWTSQVC